MMNEQVILEVAQLLEHQKYDLVAAWIDGTHPVDLAEVIIQISDDEILALYELMDFELIAEMIEEAREEEQPRLLKLLDLDEMIQVFSFMSNDNVTDILGNFRINEIKQLLKLMKEENAGPIRHLLGYESETAGGLMTTEFIALKESLTATEALLKIKSIGPQTENIETIFVLNAQRHLVGSVDLRDILTSPDHQPIKEITDYNIISILPGTDQEEVARLVSKYDLNVVPVINRKGALLGIITVDDIIDVIEAENTEDMFKMVGMSEEEQVISTVWDSIKRRLPWLVINLGTAFMAGTVVGLFQETLDRVVTLAIFLPIVAGIGGNSGQQTLAVMIRGLALGEIDFHNSKEILWKEIRVNFVNGATIGLFTATIVFLWFRNPYLSLVVFMAMLGNILIAALSGSLIPLGLKFLGVDPALASSIFLTATTDTLGFLIFLTFATLFLNYLI